MWFGFLLSDDCLKPDAVRSELGLPEDLGEGMYDLAVARFRELAHEDGWGIAWVGGQVWGFADDWVAPDDVFRYRDEAVDQVAQGLQGEGPLASRVAAVRCQYGYD